MTKASVIIPSYVRVDWLKRTLESVLTQTTNQIEVITVYQDESADPDLERWCKERSVECIYSDTPSTPRSRNLGLQAASGEIIIFFDDDVELLEDCIAAHLAAYTDPQVSAVGGRVITVKNGADDTVKRAALPIGWVDKYGILRGDQNYNSLTATDRLTTPLGCNMSFRAQDLREIGGFDESYVGNGMREETDPVLRLLAAGKKVVFEPKAALRHFLAKGGSRQKPKNQWYLDFFFNSAYFYYKFVHFPYRFVSFMGLTPRLFKYWIRYARSWQQLVAPWQQFAKAKQQLKAAEQSHD